MSLLKAMHRFIVKALCTAAVIVFTATATPAIAADDDLAGAPSSARSEATFGIASLYRGVLRVTSLLADLGRMGWHVIPGMGADRDPRDTAGSEIAETARGWRLSLGLGEEPESRFSLLTEMNDEGTPTLSPVRNTSQVPPRDQLWITLGTRYHVSEQVSLDLGYSRLLVNETPSDGGKTEVARFMGEYGTDMQVIGATVHIRF